MKQTNITALISALVISNACSQENPVVLPHELNSITQPIVGGQIVEDFKHTSTVKISYLDSSNQQYKCSGTLISDNYILTAAHCIVNCDKSKLTLQNAYVAQVSNQVFWQKFSIENGIISPDYSCTYDEESGGYYMSHDIGIIKLKESVPSSVAHPSPLLPHELVPSVNDIESGSVNLQAIGMGNSQFDVSDTYPVKRQTELIMMAYCSNGTGPFTSKCPKSRVSVALMECKDSCPTHGDSGGSFFLNIDGIDYLIAVYSRNTLDNAQSVAELVDDYREFIVENVPNLISIEPENCTNGIDDNNNGLVDCQDSLCDNVPGCGVEDCTDLEDNNGNGIIDCEDPVCFDEIRCQPEDCTNGKDDNEDGDIDCEDSQCSEHPNCTPDCADCNDPRCADADNCKQQEQEPQEPQEPTSCTNRCDDPDCENSRVCQSSHSTDHEDTCTGRNCSQYHEYDNNDGFCASTPLRSSHTPMGLAATGFLALLGMSAVRRKRRQ